MSRSRYENAMSILKLGASLEGLLGLKGSMTWTVTQKLGYQANTSFDLRKALAQVTPYKPILCRPRHISAHHSHGPS